MRILLVSDLHYDLRKLDWLLARAADDEVLVLAGDLLNIASTVPLDAQISVLLEYLDRLADRTQVVTCSGRHSHLPRVVHQCILSGACRAAPGAAPGSFG